MGPAEPASGAGFPRQGPQAGRSGELVHRLAVLLVLWLAAGCSTGSSAPSPCLDGGRSCAASQVPRGLRAVRRGYRIDRLSWRRRLNRESGVPDVGIEARWVPVLERL